MAIVKGCRDINYKSSGGSVPEITVSPCYSTLTLIYLLIFIATASRPQLIQFQHRTFKR